MDDGAARRAPRWARVSALVVGALGVLAGGLGVLARTVPLDWQPAVVAAAFAPVLAVAAVVGGMVFTLLRRWSGVLVATAVVVWTVVVQAPLFVGAPVRAGVPLVVLQANLMVGGADPETVVDLVRSRGVDVVTVEELTPEAVTGLTAAGLDDALPHRLVRTFPGGAGAGIWSRYPLQDTAPLDDFAFQLLAATVTPAGAAPVRLVAVHLLPPWPYPSRTWTSELRRLRDRLAALDGPVVASGDYNATLDHPQFRALLHDGFHDAAERSGGGFRPTYPTDRPGPPLLTLDHVVTRGADARRVETVDLPGSDHRGLVVELSVPRTE